MKIIKKLKYCKIVKNCIFNLKTMFLAKLLLLPNRIFKLQINLKMQFLERSSYYLISWHQATFPKSLPFSILAPQMFNNQVRDGLVWFHLSEDTRKISKTKFLVFKENQEALKAKLSVVLLAKQLLPKIKIVFLFKVCCSLGKHGKQLLCKQSKNIIFTFFSKFLLVACF